MGGQGRGHEEGQAWRAAAPCLPASVVHVANVKAQGKAPPGNCIGLLTNKKWHPYSMYVYTY